MRETFLAALFGAAIVFTAGYALAQAPPDDPASTGSPVQTPDAGVDVERGPGASAVATENANAGATATAHAADAAAPMTNADATPEAARVVEAPRLLAPRYPEESYPGMPAEDGLLTGIPIDAKTGLRFALHGYFRAPMRITKTGRAEGSTKANEGTSDWHTPYLIDDDYYRSGFAYTPLNETDYTELYLSVGNEKVTATIGLQGSLFSDAARPLIDRQPGISQGWLTYRAHLAFVPVVKTHLRVKGGAFWDRFGHLPKYDTYIFGRTHQMGEQVRLDFEAGETSFWVMHGIGTHLEDISANQGLTLLNYASAGASWKRTLELGGYVFDTTSRDKRPLKELTDASVQVVGLDLRVDTHLAGKLYGATSYIAAEQATY